MAGPMVLASTFISGCTMRYVLGYKGEFTWEAALLFGSIISATDPVAVVSLLKELGAPLKLATIIEGESLLNDGTAMVVFMIILELVEGKTFDLFKSLGVFCRLSFGGLLLGLLSGMLTSFLVRRTMKNPTLEINLTIMAAYLTFFIAESPGVHVSGILAVVALGLYMTKFGYTAISDTHAVHHVWGYMCFVAETVIFILSGLILGKLLNKEFKDDSHTHNYVVTYADFFLVLANYVLLMVIRFGMIVLFWPILNLFGWGMPFSHIVVCSYSGLRGAIGLALALLV